MTKLIKILSITILILLVLGLGGKEIYSLAVGKFQSTYMEGYTEGQSKTVEETKIAFEKFIKDSKEANLKAVDEVIKKGELELNGKTYKLSE